MKLEIVSWHTMKLEREQDFYLRLEEAAISAKEKGAEILFFPSYITLEFLSLYDEGESISSVLTPYAEAFEIEIRRLSRESGMIIASGSYLKEIVGKVYASRIVAYPSREVSFSTKSDLSDYEKFELGISMGEGALIDSEGRFVVGTQNEVRDVFSKSSEQFAPYDNGNFQREELVNFRVDGIILNPR